MLKKNQRTKIFIERYTSYLNCINFRWYLTKKDYKFINGFGKRHGIFRGNGQYILLEVFLNEYKKHQKNKASRTKKGIGSIKK